MTSHAIMKLDLENNIRFYGGFSSALVLAAPAAAELGPFRPRPEEATRLKDRKERDARNGGQPKVTITPLSDQHYFPSPSSRLRYIR